MESEERGETGAGVRGVALCESEGCVAPTALEAVEADVTQHSRAGLDSAAQLALLGVWCATDPVLTQWAKFWRTSGAGESVGGELTGTREERLEANSGEGLGA